MKDAKQVVTLLLVIGGKTYALLSDLLAPGKPLSKSLKQLQKILQTRFKPKPVVIAERFQFFTIEYNTIDHQKACLMGYLSI